MRYALLFLAAAPMIWAQAISNVPQTLKVRAVSHVSEQIDTGTHCNTNGTIEASNATANTNCRNTAIQVVHQVVVADDGTQYTGQCVARFIWQGCIWLEDGQTFEAKIKGRTLEVTAHKGGNLGKVIHPKYKLMDIQPPKP